MGLICGIVYFQKTDRPIEATLNDMIDIQKHRDSHKMPAVTFVGNTCAIGMANSHDFIYDGSAAQISIEKKLNSQDSIHAFVDGVVLNVPEHKKNIEDFGLKIPVASCSAIVGSAFKRWDKEFMKYLEGEFACAIWDEKKQELILARDPYGHKPLHYYCDDKMFVFSSEIKGVLAAGVLRQIDLVGLSDFMSLNSVPCPGTLFKNIKQVMPGTMVIVSKQGIQHREYWQHKLIIDDSMELEDAISEMTNKIRAAVKKRMVSHDTYCYLSGGIDSSAILAFASELSTAPVNAITVGFDEEEKNELDYAIAMAKHAGARHHYVVADSDSFFDMLDTLVFHHDSPFTDTSAYPTYYAAKLARSFTDLILTGDGPDQTMGGSGHHVFALKNNIFAPKNKLKQSFSKFAYKLFKHFITDLSSRYSSKILRKLYRESLPSVYAAYDLRSFFPDIVKEFICSDELWQVHSEDNPYRHPGAWFEESKYLDDINKYLYADIKFYVPDDLMVKVDRMSMAHSLETLSPFQDIELAKIVNSLPSKFKLYMSPSGEISTKYVLKKVCENRFPKEILNKRKQGFGIPLEKWLRQKNSMFLKEVLLDKVTLGRGYFKKSALKKFVDDFVRNKGDYYYPAANGIVALLTLELWHRKYLD